MIRSRARQVYTLLAALWLCQPTSAAAQSEGKADQQPKIMLRAAYLATNPAQAQKDSRTGEIRGASFDLAMELAKRLGMPLDFMPLSGPPAVIEAVRAGAADIGFVAYEATRVGSVEFSQTYMLVQQTFLVKDGSPVASVADIDRSGLKIGGTRNDSMTLCLKRILKSAALVELDSNPEVQAKAIAGGEVDVLGANRQRLTAMMAAVPGSRLLADALFDVPQTIVVAKDKPELLAQVDAFIDEMRASGFLQASIAKSAVAGATLAQKSPGSAHGCPG